MKSGSGKGGSEERGVGRKFKDKVQVEVELKIEMKTKWVAFLKLTYAPIKVFKFIT
ncbi:MAG: hypothetical protein VXW15_07360 [Bdellovibrionota bacterium]|nr:hypothetical protein [Bdellovibrionota bacterium]